MAKKKTTKAKKTTNKVEKAVANTQAEVNNIKALYEDFKETIGAIIGDTGAFASKHKVLLMVAFGLYLWHRNRTFTIEGFIKKLEDKLNDEDGGDSLLM